MTTAIDVSYRLMTESDLPAALYIGKAAMETLDPGAAPRSSWLPSFPRIPAHLVRTDPAGCIVAEIDGLIVGYAQALLRGDIWILSQLFVQPEVHSRGIGDELLERAQRYGRDNGARTFAVASTAQPVSQSLYMRHGMFACGIGYAMAGDLRPLRALTGADADASRIVDSGDWQDQMADLDRAVFGAERRQDHAFYHDGGATAGAVTAFGLAQRGHLLGYGYAIADGGFIAPIAAHEPAHQLPLVGIGAEWLLDRDVTTGNIWTTSRNATLMTALLSAGWRINDWSFLLASAPFGQFDRYHPCGGMLL